MKPYVLIIDWACCPDCGCNILRAEGMLKNGDPTGAIECTCCDFAALNQERVCVEFEDICLRAGHEYMPVGYAPNGEVQLICIWCGKARTA